MNRALRDHVTRVGFDLTLGKTHIATLVVLDYSIEAGLPTLLRHHLQTIPREWNLVRTADSHFVTGAMGLQTRGLLNHHFPTETQARYEPCSTVWTITLAGSCVVGLLKEAGIYQDAAAELGMAQRKKAMVAEIKAYEAKHPTKRPTRAAGRRR